MDQPTRLEGKVDKGWGYEIIWATNDKYCGKIMVFEKVGGKFSMHFHRENLSFERIHGRQKKVPNALERPLRECLIANATGDALSETPGYAPFSAADNTLGLRLQ